MIAEKTVAVVICAGGSSCRMGGLKKEYQKIDGDLTVLGAVVKTFSEIEKIDAIAVAVPKDGEKEAQAAIPKEYLTKKIPKLIFVNGGGTRQESVYNSLCALEEHNPDYVLIHDGARPWVSVKLIQRVIEAAIKNNAAIPLLPVTDTPKEYNGNFITRHLKRSNVGFAQTPQGFKFSEILQAHKKASALINEEFTDDAEVWGMFCGNVAAVQGETINKKITFKEDLL